MVTQGNPQANKRQQIPPAYMHPPKGWPMYRPQAHLMLPQGSPQADLGPPHALHRPRSTHRMAQLSTVYTLSTGSYPQPAEVGPVTHSLPTGYPQAAHRILTGSSQGIHRLSTGRPPLWGQPAVAEAERPDAYLYQNFDFGLPYGRPTGQPSP